MVYPSVVELLYVLGSELNVHSNKGPATSSTPSNGAEKSKLDFYESLAPVPYSFASDKSQLPHVSMVLKPQGIAQGRVVWGVLIS